MTDLVFEFTSTAPEMEKAASAALKRLQESALKTATILSGAGKSSAKDLRKMVDEMEGAAGGSVEALSNMASRMEQRANSFRKDATNLRRVAQDHAKLLRDAAKQLQEASDKLGSVELPRKGASAASVKAFTGQFTAAAAQFEDAVGRVGVATAAYIKVDQDFENRLKKKKPKVDLGQDGMKEALKEVDKNANEINFRISQLAKWQAEYDALYRKTYEKLGEGVSYKSIKADDLLPIDTLAEYRARGVQLGAIDKELWAERQGLAKLATASVMRQATEQLAKQKEADQERLAHQRNMGAYYTRESRLARAEELRAIRQNNALTLSMVSQGIGQEYSAKVKSYAEMFDALSAAESAKLAKQKEADQERLALQRQGTAERMAAAKADRLAELQALELQNQAVLRLVAEGIGEDYKRDQRTINGPSAGEIATSTRQARDRADELARSLRGVTLEANTLHSASRGLASGFNMLWLTWGEMLPLLAGAAISFGTAFSVKMGAQVDHTLQTIRVLSGETQEAIAGLNDQLLQLASTGPVGPLEVAEAMKTLSLAGMSAGDVSVAIRDVMNFAVAGTTDLKQAADVMTSVATAFNVTATGFNYVGDVIAKTAAVSKASVESVGEAFKTASVIHKQFGVSLEDAGVGIAALANLGIQGTAAGTALRNMYTDLSGRTPKVTKAMNELGLELRDQSGKFKDLVTLTMEFDKGLSRLDGTAQKNALLTILSERGGKPMIELRELVIEEEKVAREFAKRSGQAVVEGFEEGVKNRLQRMRDSIGDSAGFQIMARIELSETPLKQMETAVSALQSSLVSAFSSVKSEASGVALALQDLFRSDSFRSNIESLLQLTLNLAGGLVSLAKFANENAGALATLTAAYVGLRLAVGHSLELMTFYTKAQTLATTHSWAATAAVTAERVAQGPLAVQKAIATSATQADTLATWANTGAKYAAITASKLFAAALPYVGVVLAVATGAWMLYESVVGSSTKKMEDAAESSAHGKMIGKLNEETARLNENTDAMLANMTVEQLRLSRGQGLDGSKLGKHKELISAEENLAKATARRLRAQETADGTDDRVAVTMLLEGQAKDKLAAEQENARLISKSVRDATTRTVNAANLNAEVTKKLQEARQSAAKTGTDKLLAEQQRQLSGLDRLGKGGTAQQAAQNALDNDLRYNRLDEIAKANKTELDGLRSHLNSEAEALKDFRDANMVQEGEYQSRITSITIEGEKAQKAAAISGWLSYAAEIDRLLTGLSAMPKSQISDNDRANRREELYAKLRTQAEEFNSDMAKIDEEANKRERRLATDQYKELDKLRKANETAIANSKDRVQAIRDEQEMADKTLGLGGADLEATQARLKIELEAKKELRKFDLESIDKIQARDRLRADAELATDDETWEAKHRRADDFDAQLRILAKGRTALEVQLQTEVAETVAAIYRKEFKRRTDEIGDELTGSLVDALMAGGKEGGQRLRKLLEKELISEPFTIAVRAMVQPFAQAMAGFTAPGANGGRSAAAEASWGNYGPGFSQFANTSFGAQLGLSENVFDGLPGMEGYSHYQTTQLGAQVGQFVQTTGDALGYANALNTAFSKNAQGGRDYGKAAGQAIGTHVGGPLGSKIGGEIGSALGLVDYSGTMHTGGLGSYSRAGGAAYGDTVKSQGLKFGLASKDYKAQTEQVSIAISATIASTLDATAEAFGSKAGYYVATGFADDISPDGAWGAFMVKLADQTLINWKDNDKWPGVGFADGEAGAKKYAATIGKDMRDYLVTQTPDWADSMLMALGDAPSLEGVVETAGKINQAAKMLEAMGRDKMTDTGAGAFEQLQEQYGWWSAEQRAQIAILNAQGKSQEALSRQRELDIALLGEDEKAVRRRVFALEDQVTRETQLAGLTDRWNAASMTKTQLLEKEAEQYDLSNVGLLYAVATLEEGKELQQRLNEATMTRTELLALERAQILPGNQALFDAVQLAEEQKDLQQRLNEATMTRTELLALERAQILPGNQALFDAVQLAEEQKDLQQRLNEATMTRTELLALERAQILPGNQALFDAVQLAEERKSLDQRLNEATMTRTELLALERAQILPGNQALFDAVQLAEERKSLDQRLNEATMTRTELLALERAQILPGNQALFDKVNLEEEAKGLQQRLNEATMTRTELLALERAQILPGNQALFDSVQLAEERKSLDQRLNEATMTRTELLALERAQILPGNQALFDSVQLAEEQKALLDEVNTLTLSRVEALNLEREHLSPGSRGLFDFAQSLKLVADSRETLVSALNEIVSSFEPLLESLGKFQVELETTYSLLSPQDSYAASRMSLDKVYAAAVGGDQEAMKLFESEAAKFLDSSKGYNASGSSYFSDLGTVSDMTESVKALVSGSLTDAQKQLKALGEINTSVVSVATAMAAYTEAISSAITVDLANKLGQIDRDGSATVSLQEMLAKFSGLSSESTLKSVFNSLDSNGDGQITRLEAIKGSTSDTAEAINKLDVAIDQAKLTAQLAVSASVDVIVNSTLPDDIKNLALGSSSAITKLIDVTVSGALPADIKLLSLDQATALTKQISAIVTGTLPDDIKALGLGQIGAVSKQITAVVTGSLPDDIKLLALGQVDAIRKAISLTTTFSHLLTAEQKAALIEQGTSVYKLIEASVTAGNMTADQRAMLLEKGGSLSKLVSATAIGSLTADQRAVLNAVTGNTTISASVSLENRLAADGGMLAYSKADVAAAYAYGGMTLAQWLSHIQWATYNTHTLLSSAVSGGAMRVRSESRAGGVAMFASGGAFTNSVVDHPTTFNMGLMGEAGPEAIMPLSRMSDGSLGVAYSGQSNNSELVAELRALRTQVERLEQHAAANVRVAQAVGKAQIETLEVIADASTDSAKSQRLMELAR